MTVGADALVGVLSGLIAIVFALVGLIYLNLRDRIKDLENRLDSKLNDMYQHVRHEIKNMHNNQLRLAERIYGIRHDRVSRDTRMNQPEDWVGDDL